MKTNIHQCYIRHESVFSFQLFKILSRNQTHFQVTSQFLFAFFLKNRFYQFFSVFVFFGCGLVFILLTFHCLLHGSSSASGSTKVLLSVLLLFAPSAPMLNCIWLYWCRCAMTVKCDPCNSSCWTLRLWENPASKCPLCAAVLRWSWWWRRHRRLVCSGSADCRRTLRDKKYSLQCKAGGTAGTRAAVKVLNVVRLSQDF